MTSSELKMTPGKPLHGIFTDIPPRYDLINRIITLGLDKRWRRQAARECLTAQPERILDLGCGTGDLLIDIARLAKNNVELIGLDYSQPMLEIAAAKAKLLNKRLNISFTNGEAASIPFPDGYFDCVGVAFAFRNMTYKNPLANRHIAEILRVLSPGGRCVIVESSQPETGIIRKLYHLYLRWFVRRVGSALSGNRGAYSYLAESAAKYYTARELEELLITAGFRQVSFHPFLFGVTGIYSATK